MRARSLKIRLASLLPRARSEDKIEQHAAPLESQTLPVAAEARVPEAASAADYRAAFTALLRLRSSATEEGRPSLAARAERAVVALMGEQKYLDMRPDEPCYEDLLLAALGAAPLGEGDEPTLWGLGPTRKD